MGWVAVGFHMTMMVFTIGLWTPVFLAARRRRLTVTHVPDGYAGPMPAGIPQQPGPYGQQPYPAQYPPQQYGQPYPPQAPQQPAGPQWAQQPPQQPGPSWGQQQR
ncbi:hypothetical protein ACWENS_05550 [Streptomyces sp. NPDC004532]